MTKPLLRGEVQVHGVDFSFSGHQALRSNDLHVRAGEFFTLLGPSGSGKTTLLRIIAGLLQPDNGRVHIDGDDVTDVPVQRRDIGFVFQNYALFPHLSVAENIVFGLKVQRVGRTERDRRLAEILELTALGHLGSRLPGQLSGGQQQRVALGRALAQRPRVLLLDEPLGALDRNLREDLGAEVRRIQQESQTTAIYVTHDQEEAFILSDRVGVMRDGIISQIGAPADVYRSPHEVFVARFLGRTNLLPGVITGNSAIGTEVRLATATVTGQPGTLTPGTDVYCCVRPEQLVVVADGTPPVEHDRLGSAVVSDVRFLGNRQAVHLRTNGDVLHADLDPSGPVPRRGDKVELWVRSTTPAIVERTVSETTSIQTNTTQPHSQEKP